MYKVTQWSVFVALSPSVNWIDLNRIMQILVIIELPEAVYLPYKNTKGLIISQMYFIINVWCVYTYPYVCSFETYLKNSV